MAWRIIVADTSLLPIFLLDARQVVHTSWIRMALVRLWLWSDRSHHHRMI
jgi:hypothetical protein